jgi:ABC-type branched-subunit amino acid transport system substrate-binding protein
MKMKKEFVFHSIVFALSMVLLCGGPVSADDASAKRPFKIGVVLGLTGQSAYWSDMQRKGIELAAKELRAEGKSVTLIFENSGDTPAGSVTAFNKVVSADKVDAVIGNVWSFLTEPLIPMAEQRKVLLISPAMACTPSSHYVFSGSSKLAGLVKPFGEFFKKFPEVKRSASFTFDDPSWGKRNREAWLAAAKKAGVIEVASHEDHNYNPDFKALFPAMLKQKPDAFFVAHEPVASLKTFRLLGYTGKVVQANAIFETILSGRMERANIEGVFFADTYPNAQFREAFKALHNEEPVLEAHTGYEVLRSLAIAHRENPTDLPAGLRTVRYDGVAGRIDYTKSCAGNEAKWHLFQVQNGNVQLVGD